MIRLDDETVSDYLADCRDNLITMEADLLDMETGGPDTGEKLVNRILRAVHSIKGGAGFLDLVKVRELAHQTEQVLVLMSARQIAPTPERIRVLLHSTDKLSELIQFVQTSNEADTSGIMADLAALCVDERETQRPEKGLRVLLVEDDFASRLLLQTFLSRYGECHIAVNGREAVDAAHAALELGYPYHLICMDILMPEMDGREAVRQVRAIEESHGILSTFGAKIIMTTTVDEIKEINRCFWNLCDAYLLKPIDLAQLLGHMRSYGLTGPPTAPRTRSPASPAVR